MGEFLLNGRRTHVAVVHLTSDKSENAVQKRQFQLDKLDTILRTRTPPSPHTHIMIIYLLATGGKDNFIIGDFNFGDDGAAVIPLIYNDAWQALHPNI